MKRLLFTAAALAVGLVACTGTTSETPPAQPEHVEEPAKPAPPAKPEPAPAPAAEADKKAWTLPADANPALTNPSAATETAPDTFKVRFETTKGSFVVEAHRDWSPNGVDRFYNLVKIGFYDGVKFFRVIDGFMVQFGISGYPEVNKVWSESNIEDDPVVQGNARGNVTFAKCGRPNCRSTQLFINFRDNAMLDPQGFSAIGSVVEGMEIVDGLYKGYGEGAPRGKGPDQGRIQAQGNNYLEADFPLLDGVVSATIVE